MHVVPSMTHECIFWTVIRVHSPATELVRDAASGRAKSALAQSIPCAVQRNLFHLMGWLDPQLFRRAAAMLYGGSSEDSPEPYKDAGRDHWRKVVVGNPNPHAAVPCWKIGYEGACLPQTGPLGVFGRVAHQCERFVKRRAAVCIFQRVSYRGW